MRFSAIAVTFFAAAARVKAAGISGSTSSQRSCAFEIAPCFEVVISDTDQCNGDTVTYCLQRKIEPTITCKNTYSHANVYVGGDDVDLSDGDFPKATCTDDSVSEETCSSSNDFGCDAFEEGYPFTGNKGFKCDPIQLGLCVTVPLAPDRTHAEVIFAIKDGMSCQDDLPGVVTCSTEGVDKCVCSGGDACIFAGRSSCGTTFETGGGSAQGDPHFKTWRGHHFDFHGECDLVLLHSTEFGSGLGLDVHIRTKLRRDMSYISSATLRIGTDVLEVGSQGVYYLNGVVGAELPDEFSGFAFSHSQPTDKQHEFEVYLGGRERVKVKTYKDFVSILIEQGQSKYFGDSVGLMGDFGEGRMLARDGQTILEDANAFGQEWQVLDTEPTLFQNLRFPQHPMECTLPPPMQASQLRRRLLESSIDELTAEKACEHWGEGKDDCVFDVLTTGDLEMAIVGAY
jgi:hypothetical protein